jgi:tetratricopeptide (TPR) repeat protein
MMDKKTLIKTAYLHFRDGQWDHAIEQYLKLLELDPSDVLALNMLGDVYARQGRVTESLQYYRQAVQVFTQQGAKDKVEIIRRKMGKLDPNSVEVEEPKAPEPEPAAPARGREPKEPAGMPEAIEAMKSKLAADPKNVELYQKLGDLLLKAGRNLEAADAYLTVANSQYNARQYKKAEPIYQQILSLDPGNLQARIALGEIYSRDGSESEAKKEFLFVVEALIRQGNLERGLLFAQKAIQLKSIEAHYYLGLIYYLKGQMSEARSEFEVLLKFKVNHQGALTHLAQIMTKEQQFEEAFTLYERLVKADPKNADAQEKMAEIALRTGQTGVAAEKFAQAMEAFAADEQWEQAAACASQAVKLDPGKPELYLKLADAAYNAGLEQQAAEACLSLAELYASRGQNDLAGQMRQKARDLTGEASPAPESAPPAPAAPHPAPVKKAAERPLAPADEAKVMLNLASNYLKQGSLDEAIEIYLKVLKNDPNNEEVKTLLTRAYAMFAGVNPEAAVAKKSPPAKPGPRPEEADDQKVQRDAQMRAQREAQVRTQRSTAAPDASAPSKAPTQEPDLMQHAGSQQEDTIAGDHQDEFMTVTVAEIYTKQGLLNEALKIYQKILEIEPGNLEAQLKKKELESTMAEQEKLRVQSEESSRHKKASAEKAAAEKAAAEKAAAEKAAAEKAAKADSDQGPEPGAPPPGRPGKDDNEPPSKGRRGRVSYV